MNDLKQIYQCKHNINSNPTSSIIDNLKKYIECDIRDNMDGTITIKSNVNTAKSAIDNSIKELDGYDARFSVDLLYDLFPLSENVILLKI